MTDGAGIVDALSRIRVATGFDVHPFVAGRRLVLGGVDVPHDVGLEGHSDADVIAHAATDALLGALGMDDIGALFPSDDASLEGADSMELLRRVVDIADEAGCTIINMDVVVMMQAPRLAPFREQIRRSVAAALNIPFDRVTIRATTTDHLGFIGRGEGAAATAVCAVIRS